MLEICQFDFFCQRFRRNRNEIPVLKIIDHAALLFQVNQKHGTKARSGPMSRTRKLQRLMRQLLERAACNNKKPSCR